MDNYLMSYDDIKEDDFEPLDTSLTYTSNKNFNPKQIDETDLHTNIENENTLHVTTPIPISDDLSKVDIKSNRKIFDLARKHLTTPLNLNELLEDRLEAIYSPSIETSEKKFDRIKSAPLTSSQFRLSNTYKTHQNKIISSYLEDENNEISSNQYNPKSNPKTLNYRTYTTRYQKKQNSLPIYPHSSKSNSLYPLNDYPTQEDENDIPTSNDIHKDILIQSEPLEDTSISNLSAPIPPSTQLNNIQNTFQNRSQSQPNTINKQLQSHREWNDRFGVPCVLNPKFSKKERAFPSVLSKLPRAPMVVDPRRVRSTINNQLDPYVERRLNKSEQKIKKKTSKKPTNFNIQKTQNPPLVPSSNRPIISSKSSNTNNTSSPLENLQKHIQQQDLKLNIMTQEIEILKQQNTLLHNKLNVLYQKLDFSDI